MLLSNTDLQSVFPAIDRVLGSTRMIHVPVEVKLGKLERVISQRWSFDERNVVTADVVIVQLQSHGMAVVRQCERGSGDTPVEIPERNGQ